MQAKSNQKDGMKRNLGRDFLLISFTIQKKREEQSKPNKGKNILKTIYLQLYEKGTF